MLSVLCLAILSASEARAQCNRGGSGSMSTGSGRPLMGLSSASSGYSSSPVSMLDQYQQRWAQMQNATYAQAKALSMEQAAQRAAHEELVRPYRLARAEAKRKASEDRAAARLAERDSKAGFQDDRPYSLTSANVK